VELLVEDTPEDGTTVVAAGALAWLLICLESSSSNKLTIKGAINAPIDKPEFPLSLELLIPKIRFDNNALKSGSAAPVVPVEGDNVDWTPCFVSCGVIGYVFIACPFYDDAMGNAVNPA
jgi:hypothetical protein